MWKEALNDRRIGGGASRPKEAATENRTGRSEFHKDYDRIIFSSAFRRLSDKTQVVPLPRSDYTRQRLTHSLEVSCVGRSLATLVYERISQEAREAVAQGDFEAIVAAACLAHDIGNPPFGHFGEKAIQDWSKAQQEAGKFDELSEAERRDLTQFEGNAQSFRVLTRLQMGNRPGGMRLTAATLGALMKYPSSSDQVSREGYRKHGYFQDDQRAFQEVCAAAGLRQKADGTSARHPLAWLSEAADDICYAIIDLEDGCRAGLVKEDSAIAAFEQISSGCTGSTKAPLADRLSMGRAIAINQLVQESAEVFASEQDQILDGRLTGSLVGQAPSAAAYDQAKTVAIEEYFSSEVVLAMEATGYQAIQGLLTLLSDAVVTRKPSSLNRHVTRLMEVPEETDGTVYQRYLMCTDCISGQTDRKTIQLYRTLTGHALPG